MQEVVTKAITKKKKCKKAKWLSEEALQIAEKRSKRERKGKRKGKIYPTECRVPENSKERKKVLCEQCKEIEENNRMGKNRNLFKKIGYIKRPFHTKTGVIKDRNGKDLTEAEEIKKGWQDYTEELCKKHLNDLDNHDDVITHLEPDILECEVKWALASVTANKANGGNRITDELCQILKDDAVEVLHSV